MPNSLKVKLSKLRYKEQITIQEYNELISKLDGHDREVRNKVIDEFIDMLYRKVADSRLNQYKDEVVDMIDETAEQLKGGGISE